ncbi:MAG: hypothetical protein AB7O73_08260 [Bacteroidia bacterium]
MEREDLDLQVCKVSYYKKSRFLYLCLKQNVEFNLVSVKSDFESIHDLKGDEEILILIDLKDITFEHFPKESLSFVASNPYNKFQKKMAVVIQTLSHKLIGNVYLTLFKPRANTKVFNDYNEAFKWLEVDKETIDDIVSSL